MEAPIVVIGSGPASVACVHALTRQGLRVTVVDAGIELEADRQEVVQHLQQLDSSQWDAASLSMIREGTGATAGGIPLKRVYGSDYPYREVRERMHIKTTHVAGFASFAKGGLSNVWGSAVLPYRPEDIADWPISAAELSPHYEAVSRFLPVSGASDDLDAFFPHYGGSYQDLEPSMQAKRLLARMERNHDRLKRRGVLYGRSRLAVQAAPRGAAHGCAQCGLCMYGCPYELIYHSSQTLDPLVSNGSVTYLKDIVVIALEESGGQVTIHARDRRTGAPWSLVASRVFLGAGVFATAAIMLRSLQVPNATLTMRDSQYFLLPLVNFRSMPKHGTERLHTLAQVFIELLDKRLGEYPVHLQLYTYNDLYAGAAKSALGPLYPLFKAPTSALLGRLMVIQGYLHSNISSTASLSLHGATLEVTSNIHPAAARTVKQAVRILRKNGRLLGFTPLSPLLKIGDPGQGAHIGGTLPMRATPGPLETDILGRPFGFTQVHIVDASVLPSIPSTTITLNAMANAYRIGSEWGRYAQ